LKNDQSVLLTQTSNVGSSILEALKLLISGGIGAAVASVIIKFMVDRKLQSQRANYEKELEKLRAELAQKQTIHKLQFEKEFEIYSELWSSLSRLRESCSELVPGGQFTDKSPQELRGEQADKFARAYTDVAKIVEHQRPFYAPKVYQDASKLLSVAWRQMIQHAFDKTTPLTKRYEQMKERVDNICAIVSDIESSIRERIGNMGSARLVE
jgi:hypothetical protein